MENSVTLWVERALESWLNLCRNGVPMKILVGGNLKTQPHT